MRHLFVSISLLASAALPAFAGPDWTEIPDAPKLQPGQNIPFSPVNSITGALFGLDALGGPDVIDLYSVRTTSGGYFTTSTSFNPLREGGETEFDSVLFLFDMNGFGIVANDDIMPGDHNSAVLVPGAGDYLLAIAVKGMQPVSIEGNIFDIYAQGNQFAQVPANTIGGSMPLSDWTDMPMMFDPGKYVINFIVPAPGAVALASFITVVAARRRHR